MQEQIRSCEGLFADVAFGRSRGIKYELQMSADQINQQMIWHERTGCLQQVVN